MKEPYLGSLILGVPSFLQTMTSLLPGVNCTSHPMQETRKHPLIWKMIAAGYLLADFQSIKKVTIVNKLNKIQIPAAQAINEWICASSSGKNIGSWQGIPHPSIPSKASSLGISGLKHFPGVPNFVSLMSFLHWGEKISLFSQFRKSGQIVLFKNIRQGLNTFLQVSGDGKSTWLLEHFGMKTEHNKGWTTAQHLGMYFKLSKSLSLSRIISWLVYSGRISKDV